MPESEILQMLRKDLSRYEVNPTKENRTALAASCLLFSSKLSHEGESIAHAIETWQRRKTIIERMEGKAEKS